MSNHLRKFHKVDSIENAVIVLILFKNVFVENYNYEQLKYCYYCDIESNRVLYQNNDVICNR